MKIKQNLITIVAAVLAALVLFFNVASVSAFNGNGRPSGPPPNRRGQGFYRADPGPRYYRAAPFSPYGGPRRDDYGERRAVRSRGEAQRVLNDYYMRRSMRIGPIRENRFYFEADVLDRNNRFMDRVIIDKRSGRIRSIY
jgi:hypothetical protein